MTENEMSPEQLREACDVAGLETTLSHGSEAPVTYWTVYLPHCGLCWIGAEVVKSYVADLLINEVARLEGLDVGIEAGHPNVCFIQFSNQPTANGKTVTERGKASERIDLTITAAMKALGNWE